MRSEIEQAVLLLRRGNSSVGAMVQKAASLHSSYEIVEDKTEWLKPLTAVGVQGRRLDSDSV